MHSDEISCNVKSSRKSNTKKSIQRLFVRPFVGVPRQPVKVSRFSPSGISLGLGVAKRSGHQAALLGIGTTSAPRRSRPR